MEIEEEMRVLMDILEHIGKPPGDGILDWIVNAFRELEPDYRDDVRVGIQRIVQAYNEYHLETMPVEDEDYEDD